MVCYVTWFAGLLLLPVGTAQAQPVPSSTTSAVVSNIRVEADSHRVKIRYDVAGIRPADSVYVQVESQSAGFLPVRTVTGDAGKAVSPGIGKTIYWDYGMDGVFIADDVRATVLVQLTTATRQKTVGGGASNAFLSALAPGLGTIFVQPNRKIGTRPLITAAYGGLLVYGLVQRGQSKKQYALYENALNEDDYTVANRHHHQYLVAVRMAAVLWAADVVYTFLRGRKNDRIRSTRRLVGGYVYATPTIGVQLRF